MTTQLDEDITRCRAALEERREQAEAALQGFFDALTAVLQAWIPEKVREEVTRDHETTNRLGIEKIGALKADLSKLTADVPRLVRTWLSDKHLWAHQIGFSPSRDSGSIHYRIYSSGDRNGPFYLRDPLHGKLRKHMVGFMQKHGFSLARMHMGGEFYFVHFDWDSAALDGPMNRYAEAYEAFQKADADLRTAIRVKGEHDAASIWKKS